MADIRITPATGVISITGSADFQGTGASSILFITGSGNVGIGTTNPTAKLHIVGDTYIQGTEYIFQSVNSTVGYLYFDHSGTQVWKQGIFNDNTSTFSIGNGGGFTRLFNITNTGNVGIGTTTPGYKLDVEASSGLIETIRIRNGFIGGSDGSQLLLGNSVNYTNAYFRLNGGGNTSQAGAGSLNIGLTESSPMAFYTANTERMRIDASGNVGIGTSSPLTRLDLRASSNNAITPLASVPDTATTLLIGNTGTNGVLALGHDNAGHPWLQGRSVLANQAAEDILINPLGGNVGIGNSSPSGRVNISNALGANAPTTVTSANSYLHLGNSDYGPNNNGKFMIAFGYVGGSPNTNAPAYIGFEETNTGGSTKGALTFYTRDVITDTAPTERLYIASNGYVGIGTTSPNAPLDVISATSNSSIIQQWSYNSAPSAYRLQLNTIVTSGLVKYSFDMLNNSSTYNNTLVLDRGDVGIGTTSPVAKLTVLAASTGYSSDSQIKISDTTTSYYGGLSFDDAGSTRLSIRNSFDGAGSIIGFGFGSSADKVQIIDGTGLIVNEGNVGIGTSSPGNKLVSQISAPGYSVVGQHSSGGQVGIYNSTGDNGIGTVNNYAFNLFTNNSAPQVTLTTAGNVGIGTSSPSQKLHVSAGNFLISGTAIGSGADANSGLRIVAPISTTHYNWMLGAQQNINSAFEITPSTTVGGTTFSTPTAVFLQNGNVGIGTTSPGELLEVVGNIRANVSNGGGFMLTGASASGLVRAGATGLALRTNTTDRLTVDNSGNVGIGTTSPATALEVNGTARATRLNSTGGIVDFDAQTGNNFIQIASSIVSIANGGNVNMTITSAGNVGIGTTSPSTKLFVSGSHVSGQGISTFKGSDYAIINLVTPATGDGSNGYWGFRAQDVNFTDLMWFGHVTSSTQSGFLVAPNFDTVNSASLYVARSNGKVGIGTTSPSYPLHVSGSSGGISIYATNDIAAFSDESVKTELHVIDDAINRIKQINGYTYVRIDDLSNIRRAGVIAQEVQKVLPEVVSENNDGTLNVAYSNMVALLIEGMKEQQTQIDELKQRLDNL